MICWLPPLTLSHQRAAKQADEQIIETPVIYFHIISCTKTLYRHNEVSILNLLRTFQLQHRNKEGQALLIKMQAAILKPYQHYLYEFAQCFEQMG